MLHQLRDKLYLSILKWKFGEAQALGSIPVPFAERILPLFVVPSGDIYDWQELRVVTAAEHIGSFGQRLHSAWGQRPAFVDTSMLDAVKLEGKIGAHPLTALLERARMAGAQAFPCLTLQSDENTVTAATRFLIKNEHALWCLRFRVADFDDPSAHAKVAEICALMRGPRSSGVLVVDAGVTPAHNSEYVDLLVERLNEFPGLVDWGSIFFASTSFPERRDLEPGEVGTFARHDLRLYEDLRARRTSLLRLPAYADYAVEFPSKFGKGGGVAKAHLRFTSKENYVISEGETTKGNGFQTIHPVAECLVKRVEFNDGVASVGANYIRQLATKEVRGNPSKWRWCATDHHLNEVMTVAFERAGLPLPTQTARDEVQLGFEKI